MAKAVAELDDLQERLYADASAGAQAAVLLVVQGMDTAGKGGIMRHVVGSVDPQGVRYTAFKAPTEEERRHPFLWRIRKALPRPGQIGVFDRSHYEDVLIARVRNLVPPATWARRYGQINTFEHSVVGAGTTIIKVMLHISADEQKARLSERLERPEKHWKYNPGDVDERELWPAYQEAYQVAIDRCSTQDAPWFVIPADRKWFARLAVQQLVVEQLRALAPSWPPATYDVEAEKQRLAQT
jgi:PPK2 family polyphosphate:nucleotide phosphotransferase